MSAVQPIVFNPIFNGQHIRRYANAFGVATNGVAVADITPDSIHKAWYFRFATAAGANVTQAQIEAEITRIRVFINNELIHDVTPAHLHMLQAFYGDKDGAAVVPGITKIDWARRDLVNPADRWAHCIGTRGVSSMRVEFQCGTLANIGIIEAYADVMPGDRPVGPHIRLSTTPYTYAGTGDFEISDLPTTPDTAYLGIHYGLGAGTLTYAALKVDNATFHDRVPPTVNQAINEHAGLNPQAGYYHLAFQREGEATEFLGMMRNVGGLITQVKDIRLTTTWSVAPAGHTLLLERLFNASARVA